MMLKCYSFNIYQLQPSADYTYTTLSLSQPVTAQFVRVEVRGVSGVTTPVAVQIELMGIKKPNAGITLCHYSNLL